MNRTGRTTDGSSRLPGTKTGSRSPPSRPAEVGRNDCKNHSAVFRKKFALPKTVARRCRLLTLSTTSICPARSPGHADGRAVPRPRFPPSTNAQRPSAFG
ncbi:hypothetical protein EDD92_7983 [Streptomyces sp. TLI_185]|nr:hypothetical protein EDD92_7983 [Streptomyces sp. TLI_185]